MNFYENIQKGILKNRSAPTLHIAIPLKGPYVDNNLQH